MPRLHGMSQTRMANAIANAASQPSVSRHESPIVTIQSIRPRSPKLAFVGGYSPSLRKSSDDLRGRSIANPPGLKKIKRGGIFRQSRDECRVGAETAYARG